MPKSSTSIVVPGGHLLLAAHGINTDQAALDVENRREARCRRDFVALLRHLHLTQRQAVGRGAALTR